MYTSISGSGRPSLGVCSLDYAGELHKRGIQRVKVRLRRGRRRVCPRRFSSSFPWRYASFLWPVETRRNERFSLSSPSFFLPAEIKFRLDRPFSICRQLELPEGVPQIKGSLSLFFFVFVSFFSLYFSSLSLSSSLHPPSSFLRSWKLIPSYVVMSCSITRWLNFILLSFFLMELSCFVF